MSSPAWSSSSRRAFTRIELGIAVAVVLVVLMVLLPLLLSSIESSHRRGCAFNLVQIGEALHNYHNSHGEYPQGSPYQMDPDKPCEPSWWLAVLVNGPQASVMDRWEPVPESGFFDGPPNANMPLVDGYWPPIMFCLSSPMPPMTDVSESISPDNQKLVAPRAARGIAIPSYVALSGSAPDMRGQPSDAPGDLKIPFGRNTRDGTYGILSASGVFPPGHAIGNDAISDGQEFTIIMGEQSTWGLTAINSQVMIDLRSAAPLGGFMGSEGEYGELGLKAPGINGSGDARCFNVTTLRYALNTQTTHPGMIGERIVAEDDVQNSDLLAPALHGPGHNQGLFSAHPGGVNVLYADGHVNFQSDDMSVPVLLRLVTRDDSEAAEQPAPDQPLRLE